MSDRHSRERKVSFGRLSMKGQPLDPGGSWMVTEQHGKRVTTFIVMDTEQARDLRDQIDAKLNEAAGQGS